ncbi:MAG: hypothetical protein HRT74_10010, partial [Flavobacteriales bacterium]|nr:hypothetical protein [Flavobacteriales bacterium]
DVDSHLTKHRQTDFIFVPDRLMSGGRAVLNRSGLGRIGYNVNGFWEIEETSQFAEGTRSTTVHTLNTELMPLDNELVFYGEAGISYQGYSEIDNAPERQTAPVFNVGVRKPKKDEKLGWYAEIINVSEDFRSPGAQSRRFQPDALPSQLPYYTNQELQRPVSIFDLIQDPAVYQRSIQYDLSGFNPIYSNAMPFGKATPNRQGLLVGIAQEKDSTWITQIGIDAAYLTEVTGEGINEFRNFLMLDAYVQADLSQGTNWKNKTLIDLHSKIEQTSRNGLDADITSLQGIGEVDLSSTFIEASISQELSDDFYVDLGTILFSANGNEFLTERDGFGQIADYRSMEVDVAENTVFAGIRFLFTENSTFQMQFRTSQVENRMQEQNDYQWNQFTILYNLFF